MTDHHDPAGSGAGLHGPPGQRVNHQQVAEELEAFNPADLARWDLERRAIDATRAVARLTGLPSGEPIVLSDRGNLILHLAPAPVVARVATLTGRLRRDPIAWMVRELAVAGTAASVGGPVVPPTDLADPGPHLVDGLPVSLWQLVPAAERSAQRPEPALIGRSLARLHQAMAQHPEPLPELAMLREQVSDGLAALAQAGELPAGELAALRAEHAEVLAEVAASPLAGDRVVLHGDAHPGNLLGELWCDLEETSLGPRAWDLAVLKETMAADGVSALAGYADEAGISVPDAGLLAPFSRARWLEAVVWLLGMAALDPGRYAVPARDALEQLWAQRPTA